MNDDDFLALVERANLAPSVHNTQLTRRRLEADGNVLVLEDVARRLHVADPAGRDAAVSHGSAIEGFARAWQRSMTREPCVRTATGRIRTARALGITTFGLGG